MEKSHFICTERLDWTAKFTQKVEETNRSSDSIFETISIRIAGCVLIPFISVAEAFVHIGATVGKTCTGIVASPYNCIADTFFPKYSMPEYLEFSSALVHLNLAINCIFTAAILPFICLLNPSRADAFINSHSAKPQETVENIRVNRVAEVRDEVSEELTDEEVGLLNQEIDDLNAKLERAKNRGKSRLVKSNEQLQAAITDIRTLREENLRLTDQLTKGLKRRISENHELYKNSQIGNSSIFEDSQLEKQMNNLSNSAVDPGPGGEMKRGAGRGKPNLNPEQIRKQQELKRNNELRAQKLQTQPINNESSKKIINPTISTGPVSLDQLQNFQFKRSTSNLTHSKSEQVLTNSSQLGRSNSSNIASSQSNSGLALLQSGFENWDKFRDLTNSELDPLLQDDYKNECKHIYNEIIELEKGTFRKKEQDYLDKISKSTDMNLIVKSLKENIERIERWIDRLENKNIWPDEPFDFSASMTLNGFDKLLYKLIPQQLDEIIDYYKAYKTELLKLQKGQNTEDQIQAIQQQQIEYDEVKRKKHLETFEKHKLDLLRPLEFTFDLESNRNSLPWKNIFWGNNDFAKGEGIDEKTQDFLVRKAIMIEVINQLKPEEKEDNEEYELIKNMVKSLNGTFEKAKK
jgi:hypothetical protein